ncbi:MAG: CHAT domain-containing protein [Anaerolineae bacterium]|jgi:tetratricopeptide (TPR) repeat protein|nr:CHAT domain-containing protein [Anaerolineae bacterium]
MDNTRELPRLYIDISQPGDVGQFHIVVIDGVKQTPICQNRLPENYNSLQYLYTARLIERHKGIEQAAQDWQNSDRYQDLARYGQKLYQDLFGKDPTFRNYVTRAPHYQKGIRIILRLHSTASELWNIPWEYMHDGEKFLAVERSCSITRTLTDIRMESKEDTRQLPSPLRILVVISDPENASPLNLDQEVSNILSALGDAIQKGTVAVDFVEEASMFNLDIMLLEHEYHILHYNGHGGTTAQGSFLALEDEQGQMRPAFISDLLPRIRQAHSLRLIVLNGCQTGQIDETQAMSGIATGLLQVVPAVLAMQFSILDHSAQAFAKAFYEGVANGETLETALQIGRLALHRQNQALADWGIPALYVHKANIRLVNPRQTDTLPTDPPIKIDPLPNPVAFVGRRAEQRKLRRILPNLHVRTLYLWGMAGVGKSALIGRMLQRPGRKGILKSALILNCATVKPREILEQITIWLSPSFPQAGAILRDPALKPDERIESAAPYVQHERHILVLDQFEALLTETPDRGWEIANPSLRAFFVALALAPWSILTVFGSRYRWDLLRDLEANHHLELHLCTLMPHEVMMLFSQLEHLRKIEGEKLQQLLNHIGGHAGTLHLINTAIAKDPQRAQQLDEHFFESLTRKLEREILTPALSALSETERRALVELAILNQNFSVEHAQILLKLTRVEEAELIMARWEALSLVHFMFVDQIERPWYFMHDVVKNYLTNQMSAEQKRQLHKRAAGMIQTIYAKRAEERYRDNPKMPPPIRADLFLNARQEIRLILRYIAPHYRQHALNQILALRYHLLEAREFDRAAAVIEDIWLELTERFNARPLARALLEETVKTTTGLAQTIAKANLARMDEAEGQIDRAMQAYEALDDEFAKLDDDFQLAAMLSRQAAIHHRRNHYRKAIETEQKAFKLRTAIKNSAAVAESHTQLALYYGAAGNMQQAIQHVQAADQLLRTVQSYDQLAQLLKTYGTLLKKNKNYESAFNCYRDAYQIALEIKNMRTAGEALWEISELFLTVNEYQEAAKVLLESIDLAEGLEDHPALAQRLHRLALIHEKLGHDKDALVMSERATRLAQQYHLSELATIQEAYRRHKRKAK